MFDRELGSVVGQPSVAQIAFAVIIAFSIAAFVVKSTLDDQSITLNDVFAGSFPYVLIMVLVLILVVIFPQISLILV